MKSVWSTILLIAAGSISVALNLDAGIFGRQASLAGFAATIVYILCWAVFMYLPGAKPKYSIKITADIVTWTFVVIGVLLRILIRESANNDISLWSIPSTIVLFPVYGLTYILNDSGVNITLSVISVLFIASALFCFLRKHNKTT